MWAQQRVAEHPAESLLNKGWAATRSDPDLSRRLAEEALKTLAQRPDADLEIRAHLLMCDYYAERDRKAAESQIALARAQLPRAKRPGLKAAVLNCEGEVLETTGDNKKALTVFEQAVTAAESANDNEMLANALYQRGYLRGLEGDYGTGLVDLRRARALYERIGMSERSSTALNGIAILYNRMGDHDQARHYYEQTLKLQIAEGPKREVAVTQHNLGRAYEHLKAWAQARQAFEAALDLSRELDYPRGEAYALRGLASVRNAEGEPGAALSLLQLADLLQKRTPDERLRAQILLQRGIALRQLKRPGEALPVLQDAVSVFRKADSLAELVASERELAATLADLTDWHSAYQQQLEYGQTLEQWLRHQLDQRFATLKVEFDTAAKEKENALLLREKQAGERALDEARRAGRLQAAVITLVCVLLLGVGAVALHLRRVSRQMRLLAMTDELTGLPNRRDVLARLQGMLADRKFGPCALMIVDLDHFKAINDDFGHLVGDEMLKAVAQVLREAVREPMCLGRLGGEEFVVVLPRTDENQAMKVGERIREQVQALDTSRWLPQARSLTASLGVAVSRLGEDDVGTMLHRADEALYRAKAAGRNRVFAEAA